MDHTNRNYRARSNDPNSVIEIYGHGYKDFNTRRLSFDKVNRFTFEVLQIQKGY